MSYNFIRQISISDLVDVVSRGSSAKMQLPDFGATLATKPGDLRT